MKSGTSVATEDSEGLLDGTGQSPDAPVQAASATQGEGRSSRWGFGTALIVFFLTAAALFAVPAYALVRLGSVHAAIDYHLRGETLLVDAPEKSFGSGVPGEMRAVSFQITNWGEEPVRLLGCRIVCSCMTPRNLPLTLRPGESRTLDLTLRVPEVGLNHEPPPTHVNFIVTVFTTHPTRSRLELGLRADVREPAPIAE